MYLLIRYPSQIIVEALVLATGRNRMRVVAAGLPDTIELKRSGSQWFTAARQPVEFDFMMSNQYRAEYLPASAPARVAGAGGSTS